MIPDRDIDRILDAFLADGANEVPDRVLDAAFARIERTSQRRLARTPWRFPQMTPTFRFAALAAVALAVGVALVPALGPSNIVAPSPSPSPTPAPTPYASPQPLPSELAWWWDSPPRQVEGWLTNEEATQLVMDDGRMRFSLTFGDRSLASDIREVAPGILEFEEELDSGCGAGVVGRYSWSLSEGGTKLDLTAIDDPCPQRVTMLSGRHTRGSCTVPGACMGPLTAGVHSSGVFDPLSKKGGRSGTTTSAREGALRFTVPEGWGNIRDWLYDFQLVTPEGYAALEADSSAPVDVLLFLNEPVAMARGADDPTCLKQAEGVGTTMDDLSDWLIAHPDLAVTELDPITMGGQSARVFDVDLAPGTSAACEGADGPNVQLFASADQFNFWESNRDQYLGFAGWSVGGIGRDTDPMRIVITDGFVAIAAVPDAARYEAFADQAMSILATVELPAD